VLNRLAYGARPGDIERIKGMTLAAWIDHQLRPDRIPDPALSARLERLTTLTLEPVQLGADFIAARQERRRRQQASQERQPAEAQTPAMNPDLRRGRQVFAELAEGKLVRALYSERQLEEVLVDFWFNHFNVFARKGQTEIYVSQYEREAIRPHVLGTFRELLGATARSPAMLVYLDNWMSADPNAASRLDSLPRRRGATRDGVPRAGANRGRRGAQIPAAGTPQGRMVRGLNENYARELLELHTLGVDGGYTQQDVVEVARAFTGWTIGRPTEPGFRFVPMMHDRGAKTLLGHTLASGGGIEDGEKVLDIVAAHPSTARHLAFKLAQRFVSDAPPQDLVDRAARTFLSTKGNLREVVRTIVTAPELFAPGAYRAKVKTPFEFVVSALRAIDAEVRSGQAVVRALAGLGMPLYLCQPPTGYEETAAAWVSSGALVNRMNFALALAGGQMRGVMVPPAAASANAAADGILRRALAGDVSGATLETVAKATTGEQALALALGSPEFQRQ
jgi:uncharacterized protein (DUF1800 family)